MLLISKSQQVIEISIVNNCSYFNFKFLITKIVVVMDNNGYFGWYAVIVYCIFKKGYSNMIVVIAARGHVCCRGAKFNGQCWTDPTENHRCLWSEFRFHRSEPERHPW